VLALVLVSGGAAQAKEPRLFPIVSISFWSSDHGLAATIYGSGSRSRSQLAVTTDGGKSWVVRWRSGERGVGRVAVVPHTNEAWAEVFSARCGNCAPDLLYTRDGGRHWRGAAKSLAVPSFPTSRVGFALRSRQDAVGALLRTRDGGRSWEQTTNPCRKGWGHYAWSAAVSFVTPEHGWLLCAGQPGAGSQSKAVYETVNAGTSWRTLVNVRFEPGRQRSGGLGSYGYAEGISFTRSGYGLLWEGRGSTFITRDGGRNWRPVSATSQEVRIGQSGSFVSDRIAYLLVVAERTVDLERTTDGGEHWRAVHKWLRR
jgi:photosystem II stability/assembly factor-like uncharacterized protein